MLRSPGCALFYLHGENDGCVGAALAPRSARSLPPGSRFELVADAGHFLHLERPEAVNAMLADYLGAA
ncbi:MAG TPA: alpha/beta hydrolase [Solirubrobacteraceae bacterium]|jgi:pimeloyl-ACP methyl ester carboxylesterase|nr:alpha/beta hydrolase [Solirubrobacteraceae bacterium]